MAKVKKNLLTLGLSGSLGSQLVFRQGPDGQTILSVRPNHRAGRVFSERQLAQQDRFRQAVAYAQHAIKYEPAYAARAAATQRAAFMLAVADWFKAPRIVETDLAGWDGAAGGRVRARVADDFQVRAVTMTFSDGDGRQLETGPAALVDGWWEYQTATALPADATVRVTAMDLPGHAVWAEKRR
jgi:hypothetical protein